MHRCVCRMHPTSRSSRTARSANSSNDSPSAALGTCENPPGLRLGLPSSCRRSPSATLLSKGACFLREALDGDVKAQDAAAVSTPGSSNCSPVLSITALTATTESVPARLDWCPASRQPMASVPPYFRLQGRLALCSRQACSDAGHFEGGLPLAVARRANVHEAPATARCIQARSSCCRFVTPQPRGSLFAVASVLDRTALCRCAGTGYPRTECVRKCENATQLTRPVCVREWLAYSATPGQLVAISPNP
eukprot:scaffold1770_cov375-Prasinococcus_capsulatus_cf.AAC.15